MTSHDAKLHADSVVDDDIRGFFTQREIDPEELDAVRPVISSALRKAVEKIESHAASNSLQEDTNSTRSAEQEAANEQIIQQLKNDALVKGNPRDYVSA